MIQNSYCESTDNSGTERKQEYEKMKISVKSSIESIMHFRCKLQRRGNTRQRWKCRYRDSSINAKGRT